MVGDRKSWQQIKEKVASVLLQNLLIEDCAVLVKESYPLPELVIYIVSSQPPLLNQLQSYLHGVIPNSLLPKYALVSKLPRNSSGKLDEQSLANVPQLPYPHRTAFSDGGLLPFVADAPTNLIELLQKAARKATGKIIYLENGKEITQSYAQLLAQAQKILSGLRQLGLQAGDKVILQLEENRDIIPTFWGCVLGGFIPVIMEVPPTYSQANPTLDKLRHVWEFLAKPLIITGESLLDITKLFQTSYVARLSEWSNNEPDPCYYQAAPNDIAFISLSSGSTGIPKCIQLTHRNLITRARGTNLFNRHQSGDVILNWLPFDHIGSISDWHIRCLEVGCKVVYAQKDEVLGRPLTWLDLLDKYRITHSWSPSFAYALINDALEQELIANWDLSCVQFLLTAGEIVSSSAVQACLEKLAGYGLKKTAIRPAFGMAELGSGVTYYQPTEANPINFHRVDSSSFEGAIANGTFADLGAPIPGVAIRIVGNTGVVLPENTIGCLQVKGDVVFPGYYNHPQANAEAFSDGWFNTGDLGFISQGGLAIAGRIKETIIINGANYYSHEIEQVVETIAGVEVSYTAACAVQVDATEKLAIFFSCGLEGEEREDKGDKETRRQGNRGIVEKENHPQIRQDRELLELLRKIRQTVLTQIGINPSYLIPVAKEIIPKTAIGKLQRQQLSKLFEAGEFDSIVRQVEVLTRQTVKASMTEIESQIAQIWQQVLGFAVGRESNFFELGGNSLLLLQVQHKLQKQFARQLTVADMFKYATIRAMAGYLGNQTVNNAIAKRITTDSCDIAVIGMACRFPGANTVEEFWQNLCNGVESISFFGDEEVLASGIDPQLLTNPNYVKAKPAIADIELFDAEFFGYSPKEAQLIDPQQRLLLECAWESLEDAGCNPLTYKGAIGIYAGAVMNTYLLNNVHPSRHKLDSQDNLQAVTLDSMGGFQMMVANDKDYLTTRVSYKLNLTGPSVNVQTACSTSLVAIHMACQSLLNGECDMSLAGGVSVVVPQKSGYLYQEGTIVSPDGHCRAFDAEAKGTIFGNGGGIVVLKKLANAIADYDRIYAVIKGTAINNDGSAKVGYLAPNGDGQAKVASQAMAQAGVKAEDISYIEMHGTGTLLGDPIEVGGLTQAFRSNTQNKGFCAIGSVKTNIGHLQIASGVAGFIKTVLALHHKKIPPSLHFKTPSPQIDFDGSPFYVNTRLQEWESPRIAGVNSLGVGGTNAHVIVAENPIETFHGTSLHNANLLTISAKTPSALQALIKRYQVFLASHPDAKLADICFTANTGRSHFNYRIAIVASSVADLVAQLDSAQTKVINPPRIAFLFTGQGSQYVGMGKELYETQIVFRENIDKCDRILQLYLEKPLLEVLYADDTSIDETYYSQPAIFALEYALYKLWQSWGINPEIVMGHSVGEYVAAVVAGVFSLEDGLKLIAARGRLMQALPPGGMMAVSTNMAKVEAAIVDCREIAIAAINGDENIVISGSSKALQNIVASFTSQGIKTSFLNVSRAFHSPLMQPMLEEFAQIAKEITYNLPSIAIVSNLTGEIVTEFATPEYWCKHIVNPVQFAAGMKTLQQEGFNVFVECGAKPILLGMGRMLVDGGVWLPSLRPSADEQQMLSSLAQLYVQGVDVDWVRFYQDNSRCKVGLPTYPFQKQRHWIEPPSKTESIVETLQCNVSTSIGNIHPSTFTTFTHPLLGQKLLSALKDIVFQSVLNLDTPTFLKDHCVYEQVVLPGAAYIEMALAASAQVLKTKAFKLEQVEIKRPLTLSATPQLVQLILSKESAGYSFAIYSLNQTNEEDWTLHTSGKIAVTQINAPKQINITELQSKFTREIAVETHYLQCQQRGIAYGSSFRAIQQLWGKAEAALGLISLPTKLETATYQIHPVLLDACFQVIFAALPAEKTYLPVGFESLRIYHPPSENLWSYVKLRPSNNSQTIVADVYLYDEIGNLVVEINGLISQQASRNALLGKSKSWQDWLYEVQWQIQKRQTTDICQKCDRTWLIFADKSGVGQELATLLAARNQECILVFSGQKYQRNSQHFQINPSKSNHFQRLIEDLADKTYNLSDAIHLWSLDSIHDELSIADLEAATKLGCGSTLHLVQALSAKCSQSLRLALVTRGAISSASGITSSCLWGMGKTIALEHPETNCIRIDLDETAPQNEVEELFAEIWHPQKEDQIAFKGGNRTVARLVKSSFNQQLPEVSSISNQLVISHRGTLDNLQWQPVPRAVPKFNQIEIQVEATGLNFRDVLNALGLYPGNPGALGLECAGKIVAMGKGVTNFQIGDRILAMTPGSFSQYVTVDANLVVSIPESLSFAEAATIPGAFLTAYYGLHHLAKIQPGEKVLIHAATGGVGLAAVHLAQAKGAEIFATASPSKGDFLRSLGVKHIMNSRTLDFADEVLEITQGLGVDIVLNCLTGEFIPKSLSVLAATGRFVEIGKLGIWETTQVEQLKPNADYFVFDLLQVTQQQPNLIASMLRQLIQKFKVGALKPLPCKLFPVEQVVDAFRYMQQAKHIGKIAIAHHCQNSHTHAIRSDATYLITGGLGDLGLLVAQFLVDKGAKHLVLVGRNPPPVEVKERLKTQFANINIIVAQADVANTSQLAQVFADIETLSPLRGVFHAAGILDDGILQQQTWERFEKVLAPKVQGAWNLHVLTRNCSLDFFVMFSSVASLLGSAGQANYAAANSFLDALAHTRVQNGQTALSINWGAWSGLGLAAQRDLEQQLQAKGMGIINPQQGLEVLEQLLSNPTFTQVGVVPIDWAQWWQKNSKFYAHLATSPSTTPLMERKICGDFLIEQLENANSNTRHELIIDCVRSLVAKILGLNSPHSLDLHQGFTDLGIDSLTSVELRNQLQNSLGCTLPSTLAFDYPTVAKLGDYLATKLLQDSSFVLKESNADIDPTVSQMQQLSEAEAEALLLDELENLLK
jgi:acyl transferase domain-containing protein/acyl-CoA synthetase (AMP-forming)/AMP-acid ligase II/acyl carrier protein